MREFLLYERQISLSRRGLQAQCTRTNVRCAGFRDALYERIEISWIVRDSGKHRHAVDSRIETRFAQSRKRADSRFRSRCARLETSRQFSIERDERDVKTQIRDSVDSRQHIDVASDQRTFRDHNHAQAWMVGEHLENSSCNLESSLGRLVWIGRPAAHHRFPP